MTRLLGAASRGLAIFVGGGNCSVCHFGAAFTKGEFHDVSVPFFAGPGAGGQQTLRWHPPPPSEPAEPPLQLAADEVDDLVAFLESLTHPGAAAPLRAVRACRTL